MIPILFEKTATTFTTHGIGDLIDCIECKAAMSADSEYELSFKYPVGGELYNELDMNRIVLAKANDWQQPQAFRIYAFEKSLDQTVVVKCQHISYDLINYPVKAFSIAKDKIAIDALNAMKANTVSVSGSNFSLFTFTSDVTIKAYNQDKQFKIEEPGTVRSVLISGDESIQGTFGGDLVYDNFAVSLLQTAGSDRGVNIEYGVNLMDVSNENSTTEMITGVYPYFKYTDANDNDQIQYGSIQYASNSASPHRIVPLDLGEYFPDQEDHTAPTVAQLNEKAQQWMAEADLGQPEVNVTVKYADIGQDVRLFDAVQVHFGKSGIDVKAKVINYTYDVLREKAIDVTIGKAKPSIEFSLEDASRLKKGLLPPSRIKQKSISNDKLSDSSVSESKLSGGSVSSGKIQSSAVHDWHIGDGEVKTHNIDGSAVTEEKVATSAITVNKIANGAIHTEKIYDGAVTTSKVLNKAIELAKLSDYVQDEITYIPTLASDLAVISNLVVGRIRADGTIQCSNLVVGGGQYNTARNIPGTSWWALCQPSG